MNAAARRRADLHHLRPPAVRSLISYSFISSRCLATPFNGAPFDILNIGATLAPVASLNSLNKKASVVSAAALLSRTGFY